MSQNPKNYQSLSNQLDEILDQLQDPATDVDEALKLYEQGQKIIEDLQSYLKNTQNKVKKLSVNPPSKKEKPNAD